MADLQMYADHFLNEILNEAVLGVAYEAHRSLTKGTLFIDDSDEGDEKYKITIEKGMDIFGQPISGSKKTVECQCPNCNRNMAASRFAPHLEKCMGMGRNSSRIASQRIANSGKFSSTINDSVGADDELDDDNDVDWFVCETNQPTKKSKKRKAELKQRLATDLKSILSKSRSTIATQPCVAGQSKAFVDQNDNIDVVHDTRSDNINHTVTLWEKHINATLTGNEGGKSPAMHAGNVIVKKKKSKHNPSKKSKRRQVVDLS
ncbi:SAGA-associated factor 11 homolog [Ciona intestinalis]